MKLILICFLISKVSYWSCMQQLNRRLTPLSTGMSMSPGQKVHSAAAARRNILHPTAGLYSGAVLGLTHTLRGMPRLLVRGVSHRVALDLIVKGSNCGQAVARHRNSWELASGTVNQVHFRGSQALPSMRCDFFLPLAKLSLFEK